MKAPGENRAVLAPSASRLGYRLRANFLRAKDVATPAITRSARGCHLCVRYDPLPMCPGRTKDPVTQTYGNGTRTLLNVVSAEKRHYICFRYSGAHRSQLAEWWLATDHRASPYRHICGIPGIRARVRLWYDPPLRDLRGALKSSPEQAFGGGCVVIMKHYDFYRGYWARSRHAVDAARHLPASPRLLQEAIRPLRRIGTFGLAL
jgi:hypothetical protein